MGLSHIIAGISALLTGLVPMSCQHVAPTPKTPPSAPVATVSQTNSANTNSALSISVPHNLVLHDLGEVALTNHFERCMQLGDGKECILYPNLLDKKNAEITLTFESKTPAGKVHDMIVSQITTKTGESVEVTLGDFPLTLQPDIASE
ncbi:MAG: hypothetical protein ABSE48_07490 [Verrucomicrobiota bacterium]|jgi:hypothetical protein